MCESERDEGVDGLFGVVGERWPGGGILRRLGDPGGQGGRRLRYPEGRSGRKV